MDAPVYVVDPAGDDSGPGTIHRPFATLERALDAARDHSDRPTSPPRAVISLRAGTHRLTRTLRLTAADSGTIVQAHGHGTPEQEEVVVSGGRPVTGWTDTGTGVRRAELPGPPTRQLYVGGRRVERARAPIEHELTRTPTGYRSTHPAARAWTGEIELVYADAYPWSEARCPVQSMERDGETTVLTMAQPAFDRAARLYRAVMPWQEGEDLAVDRPTYVENSLDLLTEGTFALDDGVLYHRPSPQDRLAGGPTGTDAPTATTDPAGADEIVAPVLERLVHATGTADVAFRGITFADATWLRPSAPEGFLHYHGNTHYDGAHTYTVEFTEGGFVTVPADCATVPGALLFEGCSRTLLDGCRLTRLGAVALELRGGADNAVRRCHVHDVSGGGVAVTGEVRPRIEDTRVHRVGLDYPGSSAILLSDTRQAVVAHNLVSRVPHAGIVLYEGRGTRVLSNLVHDTMLVLADGGGIYVSEPQGEGEDDAAVVAHNVVRDTVTSYNFGLYTDYGAAWVRVRDNVVYRAETPVILEVWPPLDQVSFTGNHWDADPGPAPKGVTLEGNRVLAEADFATDARVAAVVARAGPRPQDVPSS